jgi:CRISPR-associated protein Cas1
LRSLPKPLTPSPASCNPTLKNAPAFVFDWMEPERPKVDCAVLDFITGHVFDPADFVIRSDGVCRLNPEMERMVIAKVSK